MRALKDKKKFGKNKIPKNRNCKKFGISVDKESRKKLRAEEALVRDCIVHCRPIPEGVSKWMIQKITKFIANGYNNKTA